MTALSFSLKGTVTSSSPAANWPLTVSLPDANAEASNAMRAWGLRPINQATRMRLGPPPAYEPTRVFGMFNLFWG